MVKIIDQVDSKPTEENRVDSRPIEEYPVNGKPIEENHVPVQFDYDIDDSRRVDNEQVEWALEHYNINHRMLAKYYIFNHYNFHIKGVNLSPRTGTLNDVKELMYAFKDLNCKPGSKRPYHNLKLKTIQRKLTKISQADYSDCSALIVVILSHGDEGIIYAKDKCYKLSDLWKPFITRQSATLVGKPKIFIIQACQGAEADPGVEIDATDSVPTTPKVKIPVFADFLFLFSSPPGFCAFRGDSGSWMVQTLCKGLREYKDQLDLQSIILLVKNFVAFRKQSYNPKRPDIHDKRQIPFEASTFTKKFYLTKACLEKYPSWVDEGKNIVIPVPSPSSLFPPAERNRKVSKDSNRKLSVSHDPPEMNRPPVDSLAPVPINSNRSLMMFGTVLVAGIFFSVFLALICAKWFIN